MIWVKAIVDPYHDKTFFQTIAVFFHRLCTFDFSTLYTDEIQIFLLCTFMVSASILGVFLVLSKSALLANSLSHTMFLGVVCAYIFCDMTGCFETRMFPLFLYVFPTFVGLITAKTVFYLSQKKYITSDGANGMVMAFFFALGVGILSMYNKNTYTGVHLLMGDLDAVDSEDLMQIAIVSICIAGWFFSYFRGLCLAIFDPGFTAISGFSVKKFWYMMFAFVCVLSVVSFKAIGFMMTISLFIFPTLIARFFARSVLQMIWYACSIGIFLSIFSVAFSRHVLTVYSLPLSTGALLSVVLAGTYAIGILIIALGKKLFRGKRLR